MIKSEQRYMEKGVLVSKSSIKVGDEITVTYNGFLFSNGADNVFAYVGYNEGWEQKEFICMNKEEANFNVKIKAALPGTINFCFKDSAEVWDNNEGQNYYFDVAKKTRAASKTVKSNDIEQKDESCGCEETKKPTKAKATKTATKKTKE